MATSLEIFGPFTIPCDSSGAAKQIGKPQVKVFWAAAGTVETKQGCYVFALKAGKGYTPWYVGKATKGFRQECFQSQKLVHYYRVLAQGKKGTPVLFFVAPPGSKNKVPAQVADEVESSLIQSALYSNPGLTNVAKTKSVPTWSIKGVVRGTPGKPDAKAQAFAKMMGL